MKNKKGFTLVELLAVIVILAIILIIAIPKIGNVIDNARRGAFVSTNSMIVSAVTRKATLESLEISAIEPIKYIFNDGSVSPILEVSGELPISGEVQINSEGQVQLRTLNDRYCALKRFSESEITIYEKNDILCNYVVEIALTVNPNGGTYNGTTENTTYQVMPGNGQVIQNPTREGYVFAGWEFEGATGTFINERFTAGTTDAALTANWLAYEDMFTYTLTNGNSGVSGKDYEVINDTDRCDHCWRIKFYSSGVFIPSVTIDIDAFLVGGGGGGGGSSNNSGGATSPSGGGGGGGYVTTIHTVINANEEKEIVIGEGGAGADTIAAYLSGSPGTETRAFGAIVAGGEAGTTKSSGGGGSGGSGGAASCYASSCSGLVNGGSYGNDGTSGANNFGTGQGNGATCEFGEGTSVGCTRGDAFAYAGGGGGGGSGAYLGGSGGIGGGGHGGDGGIATNKSNVTSGAANTGGGGGGAGNRCYGCIFPAGGSGGSGIVVIRNHRYSI